MMAFGGVMGGVVVDFKEGRKGESSQNVLYDSSLDSIQSKHVRVLQWKINGNKGVPHSDNPTPLAGSTSIISILYLR
jgi:hypothetical protein